MALAYLTINLDAFTGDDHPPISQYSTITLDPGADHIDAAADVIHVRTIVVSLDRQGKAATANGVPCVDGKVPVVAGVAYAVSAPNVLRGGPHYIPALTAGQVVALSDYITPGAPLTPDQAAALAARVTALEATPLDAEAVRDAIGVALIGTGLISVAVDDAADTITISTTATANATDAALRDRATHTGAQAISTVTGLQAALDGKAPSVHTHTAAQVSDSTTTGRALVTATDAAAARGTLGLGTAATTAATAYATAAQGAKADTAVQPARTVTAGTGLTGGGDLSADRTLTVAYGTTATTATVGNDSRVTGAAQKSANLSDLADAATARTNLGLNTAATVGALPIPDPGSFYPTDTITAALQLIGGRHIYGTGSPEGVVTAPVGTYYTDTAGTNGAWRWQKRTGAGNTGWVVTTGDGGWRDITSLLVNAWSGAAGSVLALRTTDTVTIAFENLSGAAATATTAFTLPVGYRPRTGRSSRLLFHTATPAIKRFLAYDSGVVAYNGTVPDASGSNYGLQSYPAASTWPASHPGVAA